MKLPYISRKAHEAETDRLRKEIEHLKAPNIPTPMQGKQDHSFTDAEGRKYYRYADPTEMPFLRANKTQEVLRYAEMNLNREILSEYFTSIEGHFNKGDIGQGMHEFVALMKRSNIKTDEDILYELAAVIYIREDENPKEYNPVFAAGKIAYWRTQPELINFILLTSFKELWNCGSLSETDILNSLKESAQELRSLSPSSTGKGRTTQLEGTTNS